MYNFKVKAISKIDKSGFGIKIKKGEEIEVFVNKSYYAALVRNPHIRFAPSQYEIYIPDEEFDKLLQVC